MIKEFVANNTERCYLKKIFEFLAQFFYSLTLKKLLKIN